MIKGAVMKDLEKCIEAADWLRDMKCATPKDQQALKALISLAEQVREGTLKTKEEWENYKKGKK